MCTYSTSYGANLKLEILPCNMHAKYSLLRTIGKFESPNGQHMHTPYLPYDSSLDIEASKTHAQRGYSFLVSTTAHYYKNLGDTLRCCIPNTYMLLVGGFKETTLLTNLETPDPCLSISDLPCKVLGTPNQTGSPSRSSKFALPVTELYRPLSSI